LSKKRSFKASLLKLDCPVWQTGVSGFGRSTWGRMKVPRGIPNTKQVGSSIKYATLVVTNVTLVRIVLKLKLSFIRLSKSRYLMWNPRMTLALPRWLVHLVIVLVTFGYQNTCWLIMKDPTMLEYQNLLDQVVVRLRCIASLTIKEKMIQIAILSRAWTIIQI
jgi:hypothetical protein